MWNLVDGNPKAVSRMAYRLKGTLGDGAGGGESRLDRVDQLIERNSQKIRELRARDMGCPDELLKAVLTAEPQGVQAGSKSV